MERRTALGLIAGAVSSVLESPYQGLEVVVSAVAEAPSVSQLYTNKNYAELTALLEQRTRPALRDSHLKDTPESQRELVLDCLRLGRAYYEWGQHEDQQAQTTLIGEERATLRGKARERYKAGKIWVETGQYSLGDMTTPASDDLHLAAEILWSRLLGRIRRDTVDTEKITETKLLQDLAEKFGQEKVRQGQRLLEQLFPPTYSGGQK